MMNAITTPSSAPQAPPRAVAISGLGDAGDVGAIAGTTTLRLPGRLRLNPQLPKTG